MNLHPIRAIEPKSVPAVVASIKSAEEDFEWYPTTNEILNVVKSDIKKKITTGFSILDCGAGDGRALTYLGTFKDRHCTRYAIEKSEILIQRMDRSIFVVGSDFREQTLIDKACDIIFANPPYSEFEEWATKIITEGNASYVYLVIPKRWHESEPIQDAVKKREAEVKVLGEFDFLNAERKARAQVEIVRIDLAYARGHGIRINPFTLWFEEYFHLEIDNEERSKYDWERESKGRVQSGLDKELVPGSDIVAVLETLYQRDVANLLRIYKSLESIKSDLLNEMNINVYGVMGSLRLKIEGLKDLYWKELFKNFDKVTSRLCVKSRKAMLDKLTKHTHIDFTQSNVRAVMIWVIKNANVYFDDQLVALVERMTERASVQLYVSNKNTFGDENWRYCRRPDALDKYKLDHRFVLHRCGGMTNSSWDSDRRQNGGLSSSAADLIDDILTVATNLGMDTTECVRPSQRQWVANSAETFDYHDYRSGSFRQLMRVKAFKNGNLHLQFNPDFMVRLNVEFGRLKGWLKSKQHAVDELQVTPGQVDESFKSNLLLEPSHFLHLTYGESEHTKPNCSAHGKGWAQLKKSFPDGHRFQQLR